MANPTPIQEVAKLGQSVWYDNLRRSMLKTGELARMIEQDGLRGMTSNPSIFEKAIGSSHDYDDAIAALAKQDSSLDDTALFEHLAVEDIQGACDAFRKLYDATGGKDGFVSLEVSPKRAHDTAATVKEAKRLHAAVNRPNVMIKVPGTKEGVPAIQQLIAAGISVNTTLLFAVDAYLAAAEAYISGLEERHALGKDISKVAGVASFFLSRIDTMVDGKLDELAKGGKNVAELKGKAAIANAKLAYADYHALVAGPRWKALAAAGAQPQRLLWASTGTKNPAYPKLMYVEALIGDPTVNTIPTDTYNELRDHGAGHVASTLGTDLQGAVTLLAKLADAGVSLREVTDKLLDDGTAAFDKAFDTLLAAVKSKRTTVGNK